MSMPHVLALHHPSFPPPPPAMLITTAPAYTLPAPIPTTMSDTMPSLQWPVAHFNGLAHAHASIAPPPPPSSSTAVATTGSSTSAPMKRLKPMSALRQQEKEREAAGKRSAKRAKISRTRHACTHCQHLKMRCSGPTEEGRCERCRRTGRECLVEERAPHRPWTKRKDLQIQQLTTKLEEMESLLKKTYGQTANGSKDEDDSSGGSNWSSQSPPSQSAQPPTDAATYNLTAPTLVHASVSPSSTAAHALATAEDVAYIQSHRSLLPFVRHDKVTAHEAAELFHTFMQCCALHTVILDADWHTLKRVCDASPLLFAVTLYIGSTYFTARRTLRSELEEEMDALIGKTVASGAKSIEVVQAFLLLYQWNRPSVDPAEDRAWVLAGLAIRIATELQLWKPQHRFANAERRPETDMERINRERCWMMTFSVDRSLSLAVGRPWTISESAVLIRDSARWFEQKATRPWDLGISALTELLKLISRQSDLFHAGFANDSDGSGEGGGATIEGENGGGESADSRGRSSSGRGMQSGDLDCDTMMRIMNAELENWRREWYAKGFFTSPIERKEVQCVSSDPTAILVATTSSPSSSNAAVDALDVQLRTFHYVTKQASLRYHFAVLVLNSFGLQYCVKRPSLTHARTSCITRAIQAAQSMVKAARDGLGATMTYSPQTQYTIFGFGLISLIKLAALVDDVVAERLIQSVTTSITFLEQVAVASDHTPARLASLLRAMLRRRNERRGVTGHASAPAPPAPSRKKQIVDHVEEDEDDGAGESTFAPGLKAFKLPNRSSRAVTPTRGFDSAAVAAPPSGDALNASLSGRASMPAADLLGSSELPPFDSDSNAAAESMLQSLGMFGSVDTSGWTQMTLDEILDESFWLRLSDDHSSAGNANAQPPMSSDLTAMQPFM